MGTAKPPKPVKLIVSAFAPDDAFLQQIKPLLVDEWGTIDFESALLPFEHTPYYAQEFGHGLVRRVWAFEKLIDPGDLAAIKVRCNELEQRSALDGKRRINLDSGYISMAKLVLATTKNHGHRIYIGQSPKAVGIYAEVTLHYRDKAFRPWECTYPDYATPEYCDLFQTIRQQYVAQLREGEWL
ncbi:MAG: DUF4416 family protein [Anaerolineae bacterium]|nr:DUF4416 family protein [Anaerolineae bacterium]